MFLKFSRSMHYLSGSTKSLAVAIFSTFYNILRKNLAYWIPEAIFWRNLIGKLLSKLHTECEIKSSFHYPKLIMTRSADIILNSFY